jgi:CRISPR-associated protein Cas5d
MAFWVMTGEKMPGVRLRIFGDYACFTRPEFRGERVSYDVPTPSAIRGILEAVYWKPEIQWHVDSVHVMRPVKFDTIRRNELGSKIAPGTVRAEMKKEAGNLGICATADRQQRSTLLLKDVEYYVEAHFTFTHKAEKGAAPGKHLDIFNRRLARGQTYHQPYFGCREFVAHVESVEPVEGIPQSSLAENPEGNRDLGWMLYDLDYSRSMTPLFFRARLEKGIMSVPPRHSPEVLQ